MKSKEKISYITSGYVKNVDENGRWSFMTELTKNEIICNECNKEIEKENLLRHTGSKGYRKLCKPCINKKSREYCKKKSEALKLYRSFWS